MNKDEINRLKIEYEKLPDKELEEMLEAGVDAYEDRAIYDLVKEALCQRSKKSNINSNSIVPIFFPVTLSKLIIMCICTFGLYEIYWFYRNWKFLQEKDDLDISPFWRAWFVIFYCYSLFKNVKECSNGNNIKATFSPGGLTTAYILLCIVSRFPDPVWLIGIGTFIPLLSVQTIINQLNTSQLEKVINKRFTGWNIVGIVFGVLLWGAIILGMFVE